MIIEKYKDAVGEWRWRLIGDNGEDIVADSGEGYENESECEEMAQKLFPEVEIQTLTEDEDDK